MAFVPSSLPIEMPRSNSGITGSQPRNIGLAFFCGALVTVGTITMNKVKTLNENDVEGKGLAQLGTMLNGRYGINSMAGMGYSIRYLNGLRTDLAKFIKLSDLVSQLMDAHPMTDELRSVTRSGIERSVSRNKRTEYFLSASQMSALSGSIRNIVSEIAHVSKQLQRDAEKLEGLIVKQKVSL